MSEVASQTPPPDPASDDGSVPAESPAEATVPAATDGAGDVQASVAELPDDDPDEFEDPEPSGPPARILVLDDDRTTQRFLRYILEKEGYTVTTAGDGVEALLAIGQRSFDLVLSDIHMPHLDGLELLAQRTRNGLGVPVIVLSSDGSESTVRRCLRLGAADYLRKPVRRDTLLPRVRRVLAAAEPADD